MNREFATGVSLSDNIKGVPEFNCKTELTESLIKESYKLTHWFSDPVKIFEKLIEKEPNENFNVMDSFDNTQSKNTFHSFQRAEKSTKIETQKSTKMGTQNTFHLIKSRYILTKTIMHNESYI